MKSRPYKTITNLLGYLAVLLRRVSTALRVSQNFITSRVNSLGVFLCKFARSDESERTISREVSRLRWAKPSNYAPSQKGLSAFERSKRQRGYYESANKLVFTYKPDQLKTSGSKSPLLHLTRACRTAYARSMGYTTFTKVTPRTCDHPVRCCKTLNVISP